MKVSPLGKTWILDLDGTIVKHNGYKTDGRDSFLPEAKEYLERIPDTDMIIFITSRKKEYGQATEMFLKDNGVHFNYIIYDAPYGERIVVNDKKPSGLAMSIAVNTNRDEFGIPEFEVDASL